MNAYLQYFKERLWKGLIDSHQGIRDEYVSYVDSHLDEHRQRRWKHWLLLMRLNMHYRIFKSTGRLLEEKPRDAMVRYSAGSESEKAKREAPAVLAAKLNAYDVISMDIFDTLILRKLNTPRDVFYIVGEKLGIDDYYSLRPAYEEGRRQIKSALDETREITIDELYDRVAYLTGIDAHEGKRAEYETELDMCAANPYFLEVFNILKDAGKPIYAVSDMYIPRDRMMGILENAGYHGFEDVIVSCDYGTGKGQGGLYDILKEKAGEGKKIAHIGDNYAADVTAAKNKGISGIHYQACRLRGDPYRCKGMSPPIESSYRGLINTSLHNGSTVHDRDTEYGMIYGGLCAVGFASWLHKRALADGIDEILFMSEEGGIFSSAFERLYDGIPADTISVNAASAPDLGGKERIAIAWSGQGGRDITGLARLIKKVSVSKKNLYVYMLADMGTAEWDMMKHIGDMAVYLYSDEESSTLIDNISRNIKSVRRILAAMFAPDRVLEHEAYAAAHINAELRESDDVGAGSYSDAYARANDAANAKPEADSSKASRIVKDSHMPETAADSGLSKAAEDSGLSKSVQSSDKLDAKLAASKERSLRIQSGIRMFAHKYIDDFGKYPRLMDISAHDAFSPIGLLLDRHEYIVGFTES